jgi:hypothetical protein
VETESATVFIYPTVKDLYAKKKTVPKNKAANPITTCIFIFPFVAYSPTLSIALTSASAPRVGVVALLFMYRRSAAKSTALRQSDLGILSKLGRFATRAPLGSPSPIGTDVGERNY